MTFIVGLAGGIFTEDVTVNVCASNSMNALNALELRTHSILFRSFMYCYNAFLRSSMNVGRF